MKPAVSSYLRSFPCSTPILLNRFFLPPDFYQCVHILLCYTLSHALLLHAPAFLTLFCFLASICPLWRDLYIIQKTKLPVPLSRSVWKASSCAPDCLSQKAAGSAVCPSSGTCTPRLGLRAALSSHWLGLSVYLLLCMCSKLCCFHFGLLVSYLYIEIVSS